MILLHIVAELLEFGDHLKSAHLGPHSFGHPISKAAHSPRVGVGFADNQTFELAAGERTAAL